MAPSLEAIQAVGSNGIPLNKCATCGGPSTMRDVYTDCVSRGAFEPLLYTPDGYDLVHLVEAKGDFGSKSREGIVIELRFLAYNDLPAHQFSISCIDTRNRLIAIETGWIRKISTSALDLAFWDACYERHHHPRCFVARETYLGLVADDQMESLTTSDTERMDKAAKTAKTGMIGIENLLEKTTEELANLGFERSLDELLEAEIQYALQTDPDLKDIEMSTESAGPSTTRKRPSCSARVARGKRAAVIARDPTAKRQQLDRVALANKTDYFPRPCTNTAARQKIVQKRGLSLGDRMARLIHAQRDMTNAALMKEVSLDSVQEKLQKLAVVDKEAPPTFLSRMIEEVEDQEEVICFKGRKAKQ